MRDDERDSPKDVQMISQLLEMTSRARSVNELQRVTWRAVTLADHLFGTDHPVTMELKSLRPPEWSLFSRNVTERYAVDLRGILEDALFQLELEPLVRRTPRAIARPPASAAIEHLRHLIHGLLDEVARAALSADDRADLRNLLNEALRVVEGGSSPTQVRKELQQLLGEAVARSSRSDAPSIWRRAVAVVIVADAVFALGVNVPALLSGPMPTVHIENIIAVETSPNQPMLELPPPSISRAEPAEHADELSREDGQI